MTSLEWYLIVVIGVLVVVILHALWRAGGTIKEPTYRIRESYEPHGYFSEERLVYVVEQKKGRSKWKRIGDAVPSKDSALWNLRHYIQQKQDSEREKEITYYNLKGEPIVKPIE